MLKKQDNFKKGMEAGAKPFEKKFEQLSDTVGQIGKTLNTKVDSIGEVTDILADSLSDMEKKELYNLNTPYDLKADLDDTEKEIVSALLLSLSEYTENNEYQKKFIRAVNAYIEVKAPQTGFDIACIENIENIKTQKIIMQTIMEYFYLATEDFSFLNEMEEVFEHFSVNKKGIQEIKSYIEKVYYATGKDGIAEKYGFVPKEEIIQTQVEKTKFSCYDGSDISEACADKINTHSPYIVLKDYLSYYDEGTIICVQKQTGEETKININIEDKNAVSADNICGCDKYIYLVHTSGIYMIDVDTDKAIKKIENINLNHNISSSVFAECNEKYLIYSGKAPRYEESKCYCIDLQAMEEHEISLENIGNIDGDKYWLVNNVIYFAGKKDILCKYNIETKEEVVIAQLDFEAAYSFLRRYNGLDDSQLTCQYGKYLISLKSNDYENGVSYYCLDMEKDTFDSINILDTNPYGKEIRCMVAYNYIYWFSTSSEIERYDILTRKKETVIHTNNIVDSRREGILRKEVLSLNANMVNFIGNWIYYCDGFMGLYGDEFKISIKDKKETKIGSFI